MSRRFAESAADLARARSYRPEWRNGRRAGFKNPFSKGSVGSSPTFGSLNRPI